MASSTGVVCVWKPVIVFGLNKESSRRKKGVAAPDRLVWFSRAPPREPDDVDGRPHADGDGQRVEVRVHLRRAAGGA